MNKQFVLILTVIVLAFFGVLFFTKKDSGSNKGGGNAQTSNHIFNQGSTGVVFVEYGDYQCPACYKYYPIIEQVKEKYKDKVTFQFKNFPLVEIHQHALLAARAAEAANMQGKFVEMYNKLYSGQPSWSSLTDPTDTFVSYAKEIGIDTAKFKADMQGEETNNIVQADLSEAKSKGFNSTPTFVIDGKEVENAQPTVEFFSQQLDAAIAAKQKNGQ